MTNAELRLNCLRVALELRTAGTDPTHLVAMADEFYHFVQQDQTRDTLKLNKSK